MCFSFDTSGLVLWATSPLHCCISVCCAQRLQDSKAEKNKASWPLPCRSVVKVEVAALSNIVRGDFYIRPGFGRQNEYTHMLFYSGTGKIFAEANPTVLKHVQTNKCSSLSASCKRCRFRGAEEVRSRKGDDATFILNCVQVWHTELKPPKQLRCK